MVELQSRQWLPLLQGAVEGPQDSAQWAGPGGVCTLPGGWGLFMRSCAHSPLLSLDEVVHLAKHILESTSLPSSFFFLKQLYGGIINIP